MAYMWKCMHLFTFIIQTLLIYCVTFMILQPRQFNKTCFVLFSKPCLFLILYIFYDLPFCVVKNFYIHSNRKCQHLVFWAGVDKRNERAAHAWSTNTFFEEKKIVTKKKWHAGICIEGKFVIKAHNIQCILPVELVYMILLHYSVFYSNESKK